MWYLENDYEEDEVLYNDNGTLVAATLEAYIEMLTSHKNVPELVGYCLIDPVFVTTFFTTFRLFTTPLDLIHHLNRRFIQPPPPELEDHEHSAWQQQKQERIQKRVHIALKTWVEGYWVSEKDRDAFKPIMDFVAHDLMKALPAPAGRLLDMLNQWANKRKSLLLNARSPTMGKARSHERLSQHGQEQQSSSTAPGSNSNGNSSSNSGNSSGSIIGNKLYATVKEKSSTDQLRSIGRRGIGGFSRESLQIRGPPVPQVTKALLTALSSDSTMAKVPVADIKPVELARQLTIMVGKLFSAIPYLELLSKERPNCSRMIQVSNKITIWVTDTIVDEKDVKKRIGVVKHWIEIGEECLKLNNFDTLTAISCAIESTPVRRLHNTWEAMN
ncbi:ras guanine nucleotide exchange factor domain-containing protein [Dissophora ornata]|nr:ras guanine nucleotide exchange factor domain-containing protein [Dissophora ornata]